MLDADRLAKVMIRNWNNIPADPATVNKLGDAMYDMMMSIKMDQESNPNGDLGRQRARKTAKAILDGFLNEAGKTTERRIYGLAVAIINEFRINGEIKPLDVTVPVGGSPAHSHTPTVTVKAKGKIL